MGNFYPVTRKKPSRPRRSVSLTAAARLTGTVLHYHADRFKRSLDYAVAVKHEFRMFVRISGLVPSSVPGSTHRFLSATGLFGSDANIFEITFPGEPNAKPVPDETGPLPLSTSSQPGKDFFEQFFDTGEDLETLFGTRAARILHPVDYLRGNRDKVLEIVPTGNFKFDHVLEI